MISHYLLHNFDIKVVFRLDWPINKTRDVDLPSIAS